MEKNLDITNPRYNNQFPQSLGTSLNRGSIVLLSLFLFIPAGTYIAQVKVKALCDFFYFRANISELPTQNLYLIKVACVAHGEKGIKCSPFIVFFEKRK